jgi:hypothetical protein
MENGLEVASKKFDEMEEIYSLELIDSDEKLLVVGKSKDSGGVMLIWDPFNTGKIEKVKFPMKKDRLDCLARTSGNILHVDNEGKVTSVLKKVELQRQKPEIIDLDVELTKRYCKVGPYDKKDDNNHIVYFDKKVKKFKPIVYEKEPWILHHHYRRKSYSLFQDEMRTLQLIVGRSTVQIWHKIHSVSDDQNKKEGDVPNKEEPFLKMNETKLPIEVHKKKGDDTDLPNKGEPFLEYIWTNGIPVIQERDETRLRIGDFKYTKDTSKQKETSNDGPDDINDFYLKVYWYERISKEYEKEDENVKTRKEREDKENKEISRLDSMVKDGVRAESELMEMKEKVITRRDVFEKASAVRNACKALDHLNKRYMFKYLANNYTKVHRVS